MLGLVITKVVFYWAPKNIKLDLGFAVLEPVKAHLCGIWSFLIECAFGEDLHSGVVDLDLGGGLLVTHLYEVGFQGDIILIIYIGGSILAPAADTMTLTTILRMMLMDPFFWWVV